MSSNRDPGAIFDIIDCIRAISSYTDGMTFREFIADGRTLDAVTRRVEIIGEATKRLSLDLRAKHPEIDWRKMAGTRDRLIHNYDKVDKEIVWEIAKQFGPSQLSKLELILEENGEPDV